MSASVRTLEQAHVQVRAAIVHRRPIAAICRGRRRLLCPHLLGWNRDRRLQEVDLDRDAYPEPVSPTQ